MIVWDRKVYKKFKALSVSLVFHSYWAFPPDGHTTLTSSLSASHHMDSDRVGSGPWPPGSSPPILIRTIMLSPSQGPVTPNGVAPSLRLVSEIPIYERWREDMLQCSSARAAEPAGQLACVRGGRIQATKERSKQRNWKRGRWKMEGEGQNLDQSDTRESMKLTWLTS